MTGQFIYKAICVSVYDGDSVTLDIDLGFNTWMRNQKIRLLGVDAPEIRGDERAEGLVAAEKLRSLIAGKSIILHSHRDKSGKYGRWLGTLFLEDLNVNQLLLDSGLAKPYA